MKWTVLLLLMAAPSFAKLRPDAKPKAEPTETRTRRYKVKDLQAKDPGAQDLTKFDKAMYMIGTIGLVYFWPSFYPDITVIKDNR